MAGCLNAMSCVRTRRTHQGTSTVTYYAPLPGWEKIVGQFIRITDGRGALLTEIAVKRDGKLGVRHSDNANWLDTGDGGEGVQSVVQFYAQRYGMAVAIRENAERRRLGELARIARIYGI